MGKSEGRVAFPMLAAPDVEGFTIGFEDALVLPRGAENSGMLLDIWVHESVVTPGPAACKLYFRMFEIKFGQSDFNYSGGKPRR